jgi:hypothetical protein
MNGSFVEQRKAARRGIEMTYPVRRHFPVALSLGVLLATSNSLLAGDPERPKPPKGSDNECVRLINKRIAEKWKEKKITPSPRATDYDFIRRATLDIAGRIATPTEIHDFLKEPDGSRRANLIERLLHSKEYARNWANLWTVWLMTRSGGSAAHHKEMSDWLEQQFAKDNLSYKELVTEVLTATGKTSENGAVNYILSHLGEPTPAGKAAEEGKYNVVPLTSRTTRLFLGVQIQCAQCHPHPFNKEWNQTHFWGMNAFFRQIDTPRGGYMPANNRQGMSTDPELVDNISFNPDARVIYEQRNGVVLPAKAMFLDGTRITEGTVNRRQELARLITNDKNFSRAYINRMWAHFFGRGFTTPIDDFNDENEPSHPELLDELAENFSHYGYDPRRLIRWVCNSDVYQLGSVANRSNEKPETEAYFGRMLLKAMSPEELFESLIVATRAEMFESKENRQKLREAWLKDLATSFGDDEGNEVTFNGTVVQALMMMNGANLNQAISSKEKGTVAWAAGNKASPKAILDHLYLAALNRPPSAGESAKMMRIYEAAPVKSKDGLSFWQDAFWAILNSNEFILNH